ncbi:MAG: DUF4270 domain-containing protein [Bacteroides sp.]|nr:DUF4270 domain-containing protein [Bacteroides sp.]
MKVKHIGILLMAAVMAFLGCDDTTESLGMEMLPESDGLSAHTTTFNVTTESVPVEKVYARSSTGYVGRFSDPLFGYYEASFLTELNCVDDFKFPKPYSETITNGDTIAVGELAGDTAINAQLVVYYSTWFGDSLNANRMSVYELQKKLDLNRYTDIDPAEYYMPEGSEPKLLGRKAYSAFDASVSDSVRNATDIYGNKTYYPHVAFTLGKEFANHVLQLNRAYERGENDYFANAEKFIENVFKGVYITSDFGDGTVLYVDQVSLQFQFRIHILNDSTGVAYRKQDGTLNEKGEPADSLGYGVKTFFASTKEVIQANRFSNSEKIQERLNEKSWTYLKSPAGIFTQATLPYDEIYQKLANDTLNGVQLTFTNYYEKSDYEFSMDVPANVLLIRKSEMESFFENNELTDNITSYVVAHNNVATNQYTFTNISRLVTTCINEKLAAKAKAGAAWDEAQWEAENPDWDKVLLVPVSITYDSSSSTASIIGIQNDLKPGYAKLMGGPETGDNGEVKTPLQLQVTYTTFN